MEAGVSLPLVSALPGDDIRLSVDSVPLTREHVYLGVSPSPQKGRLDDGCFFPSRFRGGAITSTVIPKSEVNRASIAAAISGVPVGATHCPDLVYTTIFWEFPSQSKSKGRPGLPRHYRGLGGLVHTPAACYIVPVIPISSPVVLSDRKGIDGACALKVVRATTGDANGNASTGSGLLTRGYVARYPDLIDGNKDDRSMGFVFQGSLPCTIPVGFEVGSHIPPLKMFPVSDLKGLPGADLLSSMESVLLEREPVCYEDSILLVFRSAGLLVGSSISAALQDTDLQCVVLIRSMAGGQRAVSYLGHGLLMLIVQLLRSLRSDLVSTVCSFGLMYEMDASSDPEQLLSVGRPVCQVQSRDRGVQTVGLTACVRWERGYRSMPWDLRFAEESSPVGRLGFTICIIQEWFSSRFLLFWFVMFSGSMVSVICFGCGRVG